MVVSKVVEDAMDPVVEAREGEDEALEMNDSSDSKELSEPMEVN